MQTTQLPAGGQGRSGFRAFFRVLIAAGLLTALVLPLAASSASAFVSRRMIDTQASARRAARALAARS
jgi:hypothetical protein